MISLLSFIYFQSSMNVWLILLYLLKDPVLLHNSRWPPLRHVGLSLWKFHWPDWIFSAQGLSDVLILQTLNNVDKYPACSLTRCEISRSPAEKATHMRHMSKLPCTCIYSLLLWYTRVTLHPLGEVTPGAVKLKIRMIFGNRGIDAPSREVGDDLSTRENLTLGGGYHRSDCTSDKLEVWSNPPLPTIDLFCYSPWSTWGGK